MKYRLIIFFLIGFSFGLNGQSNPQDFKIEDMMKNLQLLMDSLDFERMIDDDLIREWSEVVSDSMIGFRYFEKSDSVFGDQFFNDNHIFDFQLDSLFLDSDQMDKLMEKSHRILEELDLSKFQKMLEGFEFKYDYSPGSLMPGDTIQPKDIPLKKI